MKEETGEVNERIREKWNVKVEMKELMMKVLREKYKFKFNNNKSFVIELKIINDEDELKLVSPCISNIIFP